MTTNSIISFRIWYYYIDGIIAAIRNESLLTACRWLEKIGALGMQSFPKWRKNRQPKIGKKFAACKLAVSN